MDKRDFRTRHPIPFSFLVTTLASSSHCVFYGRILCDIRRMKYVSLFLDLLLLSFVIVSSRAKPDVHRFAAFEALMATTLLNKLFHL